MVPFLALFVLGQIPASPAEVPFRTVAFGSNGKIKDGGAVVMRDQKAFDTYRKVMGSSDDKQPTIDWSTEQIVALHTVGNLLYPVSLQATKVLRKADGSLEVSATLGRGDRPANPSPGVPQILKKMGLYTLIAVPRSQGEVTLRIMDQPASSSDKNGTSSPR